MKLLLNRFLLAAGGDQSPENLRVNGQHQVQAVEFLRAAGAGVYARGGRINAISFAVTREHASVGNAEAFLFAHAALLPASGTLTAICEDARGAQVRYVAQASALASDEGTQRGLTTTHTYQLICGPFSGGELEL